MTHWIVERKDGTKYVTHSEEKAIAAKNLAEAQTTMVLRETRYGQKIAFWPPEHKPDLDAVSKLARQQGCAVTITKDDRGPGMAIFRIDDHPGIDLSGLNGKPGVVFAHACGFIAKTEKPSIFEALELLDKHGLVIPEKLPDVIVVKGLPDCHCGGC